MRTRSQKTLLCCASTASLLACIAPGCGPRSGTGHPVDPDKPIDRVLMEPIVIQAYEDDEGEIDFKTYDAESLFDDGLKYVDDDKPGIGVKYFEKIIKEFPDSQFIEATLYNAGYCREQLSLKKKKTENLSAAIAYYDRLITEHPDSPYIVDALFRKGYCLEDLGKINEAIGLYSKLLERQDLKSEDKIELKARIGKLLISKSEFDKAEDELRDTILFFQEISEDERIENNFYAALAQFEIAEIYRAKFESITFSTDEKEIREEMEDKLAFMVKAKDAYVETIKIGNYQWAVASGYRVGMLLRTMYDQVMGAPIPPKVDTAELKQVYVELLDEKVAPLLESAVSVWEKTLLMAERVGYQGKWVSEIEAAMDETTSMIKP